MNYPLPLPCGLIHVELALIKGVRLVLFRFYWTRRRETWSYSNASKSSCSQTGFTCYQKPTGLLPTPHFTCNQTEFPLWNVTKNAPNENVHCLTNFRGFWEWLVAKALRLSSHRPESSGSSCLFLSCKCSWFLPPANFLILLTPPAFQSQPTFEGQSTTNQNDLHPLSDLRTDLPFAPSTMDCPGETLSLSLPCRRVDFSHSHCTSMIYFKSVHLSYNLLALFFSLTYLTWISLFWKELLYHVYIDILILYCIIHIKICNSLTICLSVYHKCCSVASVVRIHLVKP